MKKAGSTINAEEVEKFSRIADEWWSETGKFRPLHLLNHIRIKYIRENLVTHFNLSAQSVTPLKGLKILDVGCGGGLLSEPIASLGATVTGVDASEKNIKIATLHAKKSALKINYKNIGVEELAKGKEKFDVILCMEVLEHVDDLRLFLESCINLLNDNGIMMVATINRTAKSYLFAIIGAEYVLNLLPRGTHDWRKFLKPSEIDYHLRESLNLKNITGVAFNPVTEKFRLTEDVSVNFMMHYAKA